MSIGIKGFSAAMAVAILTIVGTAEAKTVAVVPPPPVLCNISQLTTSTACIGAVAGNNSNSDLNGYFGEAWGSEFLKIDVPDDGEDEPLVPFNLSKTVGLITLNIISETGTSGTWSVNGWSPFAKIMAVIKGGPSFSAYLLDMTKTSGTWNTDGVFKGNGRPGPGLSHFSLYGIKGETPPPSEVPVPAAGLLLVGGLGALAAVRRRKAKTV